MPSVSSWRLAEVGRQVVNVGGRHGTGLGKLRLVFRISLESIHLSGELVGASVLREAAGSRGTMHRGDPAADAP